MTKSFSAFIAALAISASLVAVTSPVSAFTATDDLARASAISGGGRGLSAGSITGAPPIANGDLGSGRGGDGVVSGGPISGTDLGSGRVDAEFAGQTTGSGR